MTIGGIAVAFGALIAMPQFAVLMIPDTVGAVLALVGAGAILVANTIRANWIPGVTTGVGNEAPVGTTTTLEVKEIIP